MRKISLIIIAAALTFSSTISFANLIIQSHLHTPCSSWSFKGTCNFKGASIRTADARSVQRAVNRLADRIEQLELKIEMLEEENLELKEQLPAN